MTRKAIVFLVGAVVFAFVGIAVYAAADTGQTLTNDTSIANAEVANTEVCCQDCCEDCCEDCCKDCCEDCCEDCDGGCDKDCGPGNDKGCGPGSNKGCGPGGCSAAAETIELSI